MNDEYGKYIILKMSDEVALNNMKNGEFWFRHPAFYNKLENINGDSIVGDEYDNKIKSIENDIISLPEGCIKINGILNGKNLDTKGAIKIVLFKEQDLERQLSFYMLRIKENGDYFCDVESIKAFNYEYFAIVDIKSFLEELSKKNVSVDESKCEYYDFNNYSGELSSFSKRKEYKNQNEYRVIIHMSKIEEDEKINKLVIENGGWIDIELDSKKSKQDRINAHRNYEKCESEIEKLKSEIVDIVSVQRNLISDSFSIDKLIINSNVFDW